MFFSSLKWVLISFLLIFLVHHLYMFLMNTLTVPKIKDLVNKPTQQYNDIFATLGGYPPQPPTGGKSKPFMTEGTGTFSPEGGRGGLPPEVTDELSSFLSDLKKNTSADTGKKPDFGSYNADMNYSVFS